MININKIDEIKNEVENYKNLKWYKSFRGLSVIMLVLVFFLTSWHRFFLALFILPIIYFVKKGSQVAMVLAGMYSIFLTFVNSAVYLGNNMDDQGNFNSNLAPLGIYFVMCIFVIILLKKAYNVEETKNLTCSINVDK